MTETHIIELCVEADAAAVGALLARDPSLVATRDPSLQSTPLHFAAHRGFTEIVELLLAHGADVHAREGCSGTTPLHWAVAAARADAGSVQVLLDHGADPNRPAGGATAHTPLHAATLQDEPNVVGLLLAGGADCARVDSKHRATPLDWARFFGHQRAAAALGDEA